MTTHRTSRRRFALLPTLFFAFVAPWVGAGCAAEPAPADDAAEADEQAVGSALPEPAPSERVSGSAVASTYVVASAQYRRHSLTFRTLRQVGVPVEIMSLLERADALGGPETGDARASLGELAVLEASALLPAERSKLQKVYDLLRVKPLSMPTLAPLPGVTATDASTWPGPIAPAIIAATEVPLASLAASLRPLAQRARVIRYGAAATLTKVSMDDITFALGSLGATLTAADRTAMRDELLPALSGLAVDGASVAKTLAQITLSNPFDVDVVSKSAKVTVRHRYHTVIRGMRGFESRAPMEVLNLAYIVEAESDLIDHANLGPGLAFAAVYQGGRDEALGLAAPAGFPGATRGDYRLITFKNGAIIDELAVGVPISTGTSVASLDRFWGYDFKTASGRKIRPGCGVGCFDTLDVIVQGPFTGPEVQKLGSASQRTAHRRSPSTARRFPSWATAIATGGGTRGSKGSASSTAHRSIALTST
jgi:hypothetical protein